MKSPFVGRASLAVAFFAAFGVATGASAGVFRAFLSSTGNDGNPCSLTAPCRLLPAALAAVVDGGRITMLDSANYNIGQVNITKSVTIDANPGGSAGVAAIGADAIYINTANVKVALRNLVILNYDGNGLNGVDFTQGAQLDVENCEISNMLLSGISITAPGSTVNIRNTVLRGNGDGFYASGASIFATLDGVNSHNNTHGVDAGGGANVTVTNSVLTNNSDAAVVAFAPGGALTVAVVARSTISGPNGTQGIRAAATPTGTAEVFVEANTMHIGYGFVWANSGGAESIYSSGDNRLVRYNAVTSGGALQSLPGI
jgi:hypothetical protein